MIYDIAIIGGGIAGAGIARDAALRGARVLLLEKNTFGSGTSSKSSKLIHGGLRYLETAAKDLRHGHLKAFWKNLRFVFLALRETHILRKSAPELIKPIHLLIPVYKTSGRNPLTVYLGTVLYGILSRLAGGCHFSKVLGSKQAALRAEPSLNPDGLLGGVLVWDHTTEDTALVKAVLESAKNHGAEILEHAKVTNYSFDPTTHTYYLKTEILEGTRSFHAHQLINASGPWVDEIRTLGGEKRLAPMITPIAGAHIEVKPFCKHSVILEAEDKRIFFVINRGNFARVGTTERSFRDPDQVEATEVEIQYLLGALRKFFPKKTFTRASVLKSDAGIRPLAIPPRSLKASDISREHEFVTGPDGVIHVLGVKLTDHRRAAEELMKQLVPELKKLRPEILTGPVTRIKGTGYFLETNIKK